MLTASQYREYEFPWPNEQRGYDLFPEELENDPCVAFHGTEIENFDLISETGFKVFSKELDSVSYAQKSRYSLTHLMMRYQNTHPNLVVFAVRFQTLDAPKVVVKHEDIYVYDENIQPEIIGYCVVPETYEHR